MVNEELHNLTIKMQNLIEFAQSEIMNIIKSEDYSDQIGDLNRKQLMRGERADGYIQEHYSEVSQSVYGKPDIPIQLRDTGEFHNSIKVIVENNQFSLVSDDTKYSEPPAELGFKYGEEILGLTEENVDYVEDDLPAYLLPKLEIYFNNL